MRRTPLIALVIAPFALYAVVMAWSHLLMPLSVKLWRSEVSVRLRAATGNVPMRVQALHDAAAVRSPEAALVALVVQYARQDPDAPVRKQAWRSLGAIGARQPLPEDAREALADAVRESRADAPLSTAIEAIGKAAAHNRVPEDVVLRIAHVTDQKHLEWVYPRAIDALAGIGAAQPLPEAVYQTLSAEFATPRRPGEREDLARAFETIAKGKEGLPEGVLELLDKALASDSNSRIRVHAVYALAHSAQRYPQATRAMIDATQDGVADVRRAAEHGLRIIEAERLFADRPPIEVALDPSLPVESRLRAMPMLRVNRHDARWRGQVIALMRDDDPRIAVAALELTGTITGGPDDAFDRDTLIPQLKVAMTHSDPQIRRAAYAALGRLLRAGSRYYERAADFRAQLDAGAGDSEPPVRVVALAILARTAPDIDTRTAVLERGLADSDPFVRRALVGWLGTPRVQVARRDALLERALADPDPDVRRAAEAARQSWVARPRSWPLEWWALLRAGEYEKAGLRALIAVTVAAPIVVGLAFFVYFMARLLTYLYRRRWRALAAVAVMAVWAAAGYGMFMLYFMAAHAGSRLDLVKAFQLAGILWAAVALYAGLGWALHYAVRR